MPSSRDLYPTRLVIESRWVSKPLAFAGQLQARRLNIQRQWQG
jgi:hypothetical protein